MPAARRAPAGRARGDRGRDTSPGAGAARAASRSGRARQELGDVHHGAGERRGARRPRRVAPEEVAVRLHVRAAARRVDHDGLDARCLEGRDRGPRQRPRGLGLSRVGVERPAAALRGGDRDLGTLPRETSERRLVLRAEDRVLNAPVEEAHARAPRPARGPELGEASAPARRRERREQGLRGAEPGGQQPQEPARPDEALEPAPLVGPERRDDAAQERRPRQDSLERDAPHEPAPGGPGRRVSSSARPASIKCP